MYNVSLLNHGSFSEQMDELLDQEHIRDHEAIDQRGQISLTYLMHTAIIETAAKAKDTGSIFPEVQVSHAATPIAN